MATDPQQHDDWKLKIDFNEKVYWQYIPQKELDGESKKLC